MANTLVGGPFDGKVCPAEDGNAEFYVRRNINGKWENIPAIYRNFVFDGYLLPDIPEMEATEIPRTKRKKRKSVRDMLSRDRDKEF